MEYTVRVVIAEEVTAQTQKSKITITDLSKAKACAMYQVKELLYAHPNARFCKISVFTKDGVFYTRKRKEESSKYVDSRLYRIGEDHTLTEMKNQMDSINPDRQERVNVL